MNDQSSFIYWVYARSAQQGVRAISDRHTVINGGSVDRVDFSAQENRKLSVEIVQHFGYDGRKGKGIVPLGLEGKQLGGKYRWVWWSWTGSHSTCLSFFCVCHMGEKEPELPDHEPSLFSRKDLIGPYHCPYPNWSCLTENQ